MSRAGQRRYFADHNSRNLGEVTSGVPDAPASLLDARRLPTIFNLRLPENKALIVGNPERLCGVYDKRSNRVWRISRNASGRVGSRAEFSIRGRVENPIIKQRRRIMAGATTLSDLASPIAAQTQEASIVAELKAGSEEAYAWLIGEFQQPVYGLVYRIVGDPSDAAETAQEVFLKVFRGMKQFHGQSSLKTWIYRIALHEAANRRRWWFRHKAQETSIEPADSESMPEGSPQMQMALTDHAESPFDNVAHHEVQRRVEEELRKIPEPYRTTLILRDLEEMSYEEIAEVLEISLGTVKSRLTRGREALKQRLTPYIREVGAEMGLTAPQEKQREPRVSGGGRRVEVIS
jgi:RNA polymerase sigma-70 factor, ECF subfamily